MILKLLFIVIGIIGLLALILWGAKDKALYKHW